MQLKQYLGTTDPEYLDLLATLAKFKRNSKRVIQALQEMDSRIPDDIGEVDAEIDKGTPLTKKELKSLFDKHKDTSDVMMKSLIDALETAIAHDFRLENLSAIASDIKRKHPHTKDKSKGNCGNCDNWRLLPYFDVDKPERAMGECQQLEVEGHHLKTRPDFACIEWRAIPDGE